MGPILPAIAAARLRVTRSCPARSAPGLPPRRVPRPRKARARRRPGPRHARRRGARRLEMGAGAAATMAAIAVESVARPRPVRAAARARARRAPGRLLRRRAGSRRSRRSGRRASGSNQEPWTKRRLRSPSRAAFRLATASAAALASVAVTTASGRSQAMASAIAPLPVPRSRTDGRARGRAIARERALDDEFRFRPRHQHVRRHLELERPEFAPPGEVGDGFAGEPAARERLECEQLPRGASVRSGSAASAERPCRAHARRVAPASSAADGRCSVEPLPERREHAGDARHSSAASSSARCSRASVSITSSRLPSTMSSSRYSVSSMRWSVRRPCGKL